MNILNYTTRPVSWQIGLWTDQQDDLLDTMLNALCTEEFLEANPELNPAEILQALIDREAMHTTALGHSLPWVFCGSRSSSAGSRFKSSV